MKTKLLNLWEKIRTSFWFIPTLMLSAAIAVSFIMAFIDEALDLDPKRRILGFLYVWEPEGARFILSTIASSMMTIVAIVFPITIVALTLASSQFGPRLLRNFMKDKGHQIVLGTYIATFIYCLLILRLISGADSSSSVPNLSISLAILLALMNISVLIYFIHHICTSIQADHIISVVYQDLLYDIRRLFPEEIGYDLYEEKKEDIPVPKVKDFCETNAVDAKKSGYLLAIDSDGLLDIAENSDLLLYLNFRPGQFVATGSNLVTVKSEESLEQEVLDKISNDFILGSRRTPEQDPEFAIHQLVEIAVRALSPGINDPFTAISCIDRLGSALCHLTKRVFPSPYRYDKVKNLRVITKPITFMGITNAAFDQIRQYGRKNPAIAIRLLETLTMIAPFARNKKQQHALIRQGYMIEQASQVSIIERNDREDVTDRYQALLKAFDGIAFN